MSRADYYCTDCGKTHDECYCDWEDDGGSVAQDNLDKWNEYDDEMGPEEGQQD